MTHVSFVEVITHGLRLMGTAFVIGIVAGLLIVGGIEFQEAAGIPYMGYFIIFLGVLVAIAGYHGMLFKVIAEGVARGRRP